jgi:two-component system, NarL family, sensor kinase
MRKTVFAFLLFTKGLCFAGDPDPFFSASEIEQQKLRIQTIIHQHLENPGSHSQKASPYYGHEGAYDSAHAFFYDVNALKYNPHQFAKYAVLILLIQKSTAFYNSRQYDSSLHYLQAALELSVTYRFVFHELYHIRPAMNNLYFLAGNMTGVIKISARGLVTAEKYNNPVQAAHFTNVIGHVHLKYKNYKEARSYFDTYLAQTTALNDKMLIAHAHENLADLHIAQKDADRSIYHLNLSKNFYALLAEEEKINTITLRNRNLHIHYKIAEALLLKQDCINAVSYIIPEAVLDTIQNVNGYDLASYYIHSGMVYNCLQQPAKAMQYLLKGVQKALAEKHVEYTRDAFEQIAVAYSRLQQYDSAWKYNELYWQLRNTLENEKNVNDLFQKENIMRLEMEQQKYNAALARQKMLRNILGMLALCILLFAILLYNRYRLKQKNLLQQQQNKQQQELLATTITAQDLERKRIAQDLHDGLGSLLSAAKLKLSDLREPEDAQEKEKVQASVHLIDEAMREMKNISYGMMPATLLRLGLTAALQNLLNQIHSKNKLQIHYSHYGFEERLNEATELNIYRIVLECINNTVQHADATTATVQLIKHEHYINIVVEDNGKGFDATNETVSGNGLYNIFTRVQNSRGTIDIDSQPGSGTSIIIDLPYP